MNKKIVRLAITLIAMGTWFPNVQASENLGQVGILLVPGGSMAFAGVEERNSGTTYRIGTFSYEYSDEDYQEWGEGTILGIGKKFFSSEEQLGGYFGLTLDYVSVDGGYYEWGAGTSWFSGSGLLPGVMAGTRIENGSNYIEPNISLGLLNTEQSSSMLIALGVIVSF